MENCIENLRSVRNMLFNRNQSLKMSLQDTSVTILPNKQRAVPDYFDNRLRHIEPLEEVLVLPKKRDTSVNKNNQNPFNLEPDSGFQSEETEINCTQDDSLKNGSVEIEIEQDFEGLTCRVYSPSPGNTPVKLTLRTDSGYSSVEKMDRSFDWKKTITVGTQFPTSNCEDEDEYDGVRRSHLRRTDSSECSLSISSIEEGEVVGWGDENCEDLSVGEVRYSRNSSQKRSNIDPTLTEVDLDDGVQADITCDYELSDDDVSVSDRMTSVSLLSSERDDVHSDRSSSASSSSFGVFDEIPCSEFETDEEVLLEEVIVK